MLLLAPTGAFAQTTDPDRGSPSGTVYEIPLEAGRDDAAPGGRSRQGKDRDAPGSSIHSDNGFGSSTNVPGTGESKGGDAGGAGSADADGTAGGGSSASGGAFKSSGSSGSSGSRDTSEGGSGSDGGRAEESDIPEGEAAQPTASAIVARQEAGTPSIPRTFLLLGLGVLVAAGLAAAARMALRRR